MAPPSGFEASPSGVSCPSCRSHLIRKFSEDDEGESASKSRGNVAINDADEETNRAIASSLESARCANLLLQAMSFDKATRGEITKDLDPISGVSYCPECRVHVITDATELERLFDEVSFEYGSDDEAIEECLRGGVYVVVDEAEVSALIRLRQEKELAEMKAAASYDDGRDSLPTKPSEFDYPYRHKVASKVMGSKIGQGYTLLEDICPECEMPLMEESDETGPECVVCPKLFKKLSKMGVLVTTVTADTADDPNRKDEDEDYQVDPDDPVSFIIAEARRAIKTEKSSKESGVSRVADAKEFLQQRLVQRGISIQSSERTATLVEPPTMDDAIVEAEPVVNWDDLLVNGRKLLSERLKCGWELSNENCKGANCKGTPLTNFEGNSDSCAVCGGTGSGFDGAYEICMKSVEVVEAERELVSQEICNLMSKGWILRDRLCEMCSMPLVSEHANGVDLCILCGDLPQNARPDNYRENGPLAQYFDENNANEAGEKLLKGWTLPQAPLCNQCGGIQMITPDTNECGCINTRCPSALPAAYPNRADTIRTSLEPEAQNDPVQSAPPQQRHPNGKSIGGSRSNDGPPLEVGGMPTQYPQCDDPSVLSDDMSQVRSVASSALGAILVRLDDAKVQLELLQENGDADALECAQKQVEIATLIEKLASAAVAMKQMEDIDEE